MHSRLMFYMLILVTLITSCAEEEILSTHTNNNPKLVNYYELGKSDEYVQKKFDKLGGLVSSATFVDGVIHGDYVEYWENGQVKLIKSFVEGVAEGWEKSFHQNGSKHTQGYIITGRLSDGNYISWHENGKVESEYAVKAGKADGEWLMYHKNGQLQLQGVYQNDSLVGLYEEYDEEGQLLNRKFYGGDQLSLLNRITPEVDMDFTYQLSGIDDLYGLIQLPDDMSTSSVNKYIYSEKKDRKLLSGTINIVKSSFGHTRFVGQVGVLVDVEPKAWHLSTKPKKITSFITDYSSIELWNGLYIGCRRNFINLSGVTILQEKVDTLSFIDQKELYYELVFRNDRIEKIEVRNDRKI